MSASTVTQRLLPPTFLQEALAQEVHKLLSLKYARPILEALAGHIEGLEVRWLDVKVVGLEGSSKTASVVAKKLRAAGWVTPKPGTKPERLVLTAKGREALELAQKGDSIGSSGVGD